MRVTPVSVTPVRVESVITITISIWVLETAPDVEPFVTAAPVVTIQEVANEPSTFDEEREDEILTHSIESEDSMDESESTAVSNL